MRKHEQESLVGSAEGSAYEMVEPDNAGIAQMASADAMVAQMLQRHGRTMIEVGQIQGFQFIRHVVDVAAAQIYVKIKESKAYKGMPYKDEAGNIRHVGGLKEFCELFMGRSYNRMQELESNLRLLGTDLYEAAQEVGFQARDYSGLKALPADDREAVTEALGGEDKSRALELLAELVARQAEEKERIRAEQMAQKDAADELRSEGDAQRRVIADKQSRIADLQTQLERKKLEPMEPMEERGRLMSQLTEQVLQAEFHLRQVTHSISQIKGQARETGVWTDDFVAGAINTLKRAVWELDAEFGEKPESYDPWSDKNPHIFDISAAEAEQRLEAQEQRSSEERPGLTAIPGGKANH